MQTGSLIRANPPPMQDRAETRAFKDHNIIKTLFLQIRDYSRFSMMNSIGD
ncbi:MAG: hypothetical protein LBI14_00680 [Treponema sp.]|nr:hypothetical protein [Treponema sp.]